MNTHLQFFEQIKKVTFYLLEHYGTVELQTLADFYKADSDNQKRMDGLGALLEETVLLLHSIDLPPDEPIVTIIAKLNDIESALNALQMCYDNFKAEYQQSGDTTEARQAAKNLNDRISDDVFRPFDFNKLVDRLEIYIALKQKRGPVDFEISPGLISYHGKKIILSAGRQTEIFTILVKHFNSVVPHKELDPAYSRFDSQNLRTAISKINSALKRSKTGLIVNSIQNEGYCLTRQNHHKR